MDITGVWSEDVNSAQWLPLVKKVMDTEFLKMGEFFTSGVSASISRTLRHGGRIVEKQFCSILVVNTTIKTNQSNCLHWYNLITATCFGPHLG
jgi:hypothetical protein